MIQLGGIFAKYASRREPTVRAPDSKFGSFWRGAWFVASAGYVLAIHELFLIKIQDPLIHPDTLSYLTPALDLLFYHTWTLNPVRTAGYPIFLYLFLALGTGFKGILYAQHFLVIATGVTAGAVSFRLFSRSWMSASAVAFLSALSPEATVASHAILSDTLYAAFVMTATFYFLHLSLAPQLSKRSWVLLGVLVSCSVLVRPMGYALLLSLGLMGFVNKRTWGVNMIFLGSTLTLLLMYSGFNKARHDFFGVTQIASPRLFGMAAHYLDVNQVQDGALREVLAPIYAKYPEKMKDTVWVSAAPEGPAQAVMKLYPDAKGIRILAQLSRQAIFSHVWEYAGEQASLLWIFFTQTMVPPAIYWQPEYCFFIFRGLDLAASF